MVSVPAESLPLFPLGIVLVPEMLLPLHLFEERYRRLMRDRATSDPLFGVVLTRRGLEVGDRPETHRVGTSASLVGGRQYPDGRYDIVVQGRRRFQVVDAGWSSDYLTGTITWLDPTDQPTDEMAEERLAVRVAKAYHDFVESVARQARAVIPRDSLPAEPAPLSYHLIGQLPINTWEQQRLLELPSTHARLEQLLALLQRERQLLTELGVGGSTIERPGRNVFLN